MDRPILYAIVPDTDDRWMALVLLPENLEIEEYRPTLSTEEEIRDLADMHPYVKQKYGESAVYASAGVLKELQEALRPWERFHTPEMLALLADNYTGNDLTLYCVYGSRSRPMSASWCKNVGAVFIDADYAKTQYHTYVAVPLPLSEEQLQHYNLAFVSGFHFPLELWVLFKDYEQTRSVHDDGADNHLIDEILDKAQELGFTFVHNHALNALQIVRIHPKQQEAGQTLFTAKDLLFAQIRGLVLHLDARSGWEEDNRVQNGVDAMEVFYGYANEHHYQALVAQFEQLGESAYAEFISYWNSFPYGQKSEPQADSAQWVNCVSCGHPVYVQITQEGGPLGWTRYSYACSCGHNEADIGAPCASGHVLPERVQNSTEDVNTF